MPRRSLRASDSRRRADRQRHAGEDVAWPGIGVIMADDGEIGKPVPCASPEAACAPLPDSSGPELGPRGLAAATSQSSPRRRRHARERRPMGAERTADESVEARALATSRSFPMRSFSARASLARTVELGRRSGVVPRLRRTKSWASALAPQIPVAAERGEERVVRLRGRRGDLLPGQRGGEVADRTSAVPTRPCSRNLSMNGIVTVAARLGLAPPAPKRPFAWSKTAPGRASRCPDLARAPGRPAQPPPGAGAWPTLERSPVRVRHSGRVHLGGSVSWCPRSLPRSRA